MSEHPSYRIETLADFLKVPEDRMAVCLDEFADWCAVMRRTEALLRTLAPNHPKDKPVMAHEVFTWVDDGLRNVTMTVQCTDGDVEMHWEDTSTDGDASDAP